VTEGEEEGELCLLTISLLTPTLISEFSFFEENKYSMFIINLFSLYF